MRFFRVLRAKRRAVIDLSLMFLWTGLFALEMTDPFKGVMHYFLSCLYGFNTLIYLVLVWFHWAYSLAIRGQVWFPARDWDHLDAIKAYCEKHRILHETKGDTVGFVDDDDMIQVKMAT